MSQYATIKELPELDEIHNLVDGLSISVRMLYGMYEVEYYCTEGHWTYSLFTRPQMFTTAYEAVEFTNGLLALFKVKATPDGICYQQNQ